MKEPKLYKVILRLLAAFAVFGIIQFVGGLLIEYIIIYAGLQNEMGLKIFIISRILLIIFIAFPIFLLITKADLSMYRKIGSVTKKPSILLLFISLLLLIAVTAIPAIIMGLNNPDYIVKPDNSFELFQIIVWSVIASPIIEESISRGTILNKIKPFGWKKALIISTLLFALGHQNPFNMIISIIPGILFGLAILYTGSLLYPIILHMSFNLYGTLLLPILFSHGIPVLLGGTLVYIILVLGIFGLIGKLAQKSGL